MILLCFADISLIPCTQCIGDSCQFFTLKMCIDSFLLGRKKRRLIAFNFINTEINGSEMGVEKETCQQEVKNWPIHSFFDCTARSFSLELSH